jgi:putative tryptophan/tyrosine transport system substrate-binding protein
VIVPACDGIERWRDVVWVRPRVVVEVRSCAASNDALTVVVDRVGQSAYAAGNMSTTRRTFLTGSFALLVAPLAAEAQSGGAVPAIGLLGSSTDGYRALKEWLHDLGWVEGHTVRFEERVSADYRELPRLATELVRMQVDVIFAGNAPSVRAAMNATRAIPIVMVSGDPVSAGFVASLARPGANVTGLAIMHTDLSGKRLEILTQALPAARRIAVLGNPANPSTPAMIRETEARARSLGVLILRFEATAPDRLAAAVAAAARDRADALAVLGDPMFNQNHGRLVEAAAQHRLPAIWEWREIVEAGGFMSYAPQLADLQRRAATYVDRILKGTNPGALPVQQPTKFELVINLKTAKALGLTIPPSLLLRADQVIE